MTRRTLLIGLDGATFDVLDPLVQDGVMPCLGRLTAEGARAVLRSTVPALAPPAWTSLVTGRSPGVHGIFDFFRKNSPSSLHFGLVTSGDVTATPMWSLVSAAALRSTVLNFPLTFPPPPIEGHIVPGGFMPWRQLRLGCHPQHVFDELRTLPSFNPRELALDMSEEAKAIEGCGEEEYEPWIDMHIRRERQWVDILRHLAHTEPAEFTAVLFDGVDKIQHLCWRFIDPRMAGTLVTDWERRVRAKCIEYFSELDRRIEDLVTIVPEETTVVIASDHGFGPQVRTFFANAWLEQTGRLAWRQGESPVGANPAALGLNQLTKHVFQLDWDRTRAFAPLPSGSGIHIVRADDQHPNGVSEDEYESFRDRLAADLLTLRDPETGDRVVSHVYTREEVFAGPHVALAPDLTLELEDGGLISILASTEAVRRRPLPTGTHRPDGVLIAHGPDVQRGSRIGPLSIVDVAPLLLYALDLPIPDALEGRLVTEALDSGALARRPPRHGREAPALAAATVAAAGLDSDAEAEILKRLQALGYVE